MKNFKKLIKEAYLGNPLNEDRYLKNPDSYIKVTEPRFRKDKNNPNFLYGYINYDTGPGVSTALGKETMAGQIKRLSSMEAMRRMKAIAVQLEDAFDIEDIEVTDLENGQVNLFAVSDDFIDIDPKSELSMAMLNETAGTFGDGVSDEIKAKYNKAAMDEYGKPFAELDIFQKQEIMSAIVKYSGPEFKTDFQQRRQGDLGDEYDGMTDYQRGRMDEDMGEWPKEFTSRYSDEYRFELEKVMSDRAKYRVIDIESGELKGTPVFEKPESLMAYADDLIKPQGGTQSSHFGTNEGTCGYGEDGKIGKIPAGAHLQKEESEGDKEIRALEKKAEKYPKGDSRREAIQKKIGDLKSDKDYALPGSKADKKFSDMSDKEVDDEVRRLLKRNFMEENMNDPVLVKARAAKMAGEKEKAKQAALDKKYGSSFMDKLDAEIGLKQELASLKAEYDDIINFQQENDPEVKPEGGEKADEYGGKLNDIDARMAEIKSELDDLRMYESVNEDDEFNVNVDNANDNYAKAIDAESRSGAYESLQESLRKKLQDRLK